MAINSTITLKNGVIMPKLIQGLPLIMGLSGMKQKRFNEIINCSISCGITAFDTSHDYGKSEQYLGKALKMLHHEKGINRNDIFIVTKIGNGQQYEGNINMYVEQSLMALQTDYIDLMLLHWPVPDYYIENWRKLDQVFETGKIKAIGIANAQIRHLEALFDAGVKYVPHVLQTEIHPFNTCDDIVEYCKDKNITLQACTSLCQMVPMVKENAILQELAKKYNRSIAQIILRWHVEQDIAPVFRSYNETHLMEMQNIYNFELTPTDMQLISELNINYRYHPESLNCPGF
jgi:diketogulonate reductase-like aldo/keto reductase